MANGASRLFNIIQHSGTDTVSEAVYLTVKSTNPLVFNLESRFDITPEFYVLSDSIIKSKLRTGDKVFALTFNQGQVYFITQALDKNVKFEIIDNLSSNSSVDVLSANQGRLLSEQIKSLNLKISELEGKL